MISVNGRFDQAARLFYFDGQEGGVPATRELGLRERVVNAVHRQWVKVQIDGQPGAIYIRQANLAQFQPIRDDSTPTPTSDGSEAASPMTAIEISDRVRGLYHQHPDILGGVTLQEFALMLELIDHSEAVPNEEIFRSSETGLARTIYKNSAGHFFIVLDKQSRGDGMINLGSFKKVSFALQYTPRDDQMIKRIRYTSKKPQYLDPRFQNPDHIASMVPAFRKECEFLTRLSGKPGLPEVLMQGEFYSKKAGETRQFVIVPFYNSGDGFDLLDKADAPPLTSWQRLHIIFDAVQGLSEMHAAGIYNRDVKLENILIHDSSRAVLADFGLACDAHDERVLGQFCGSPSFINPDMRFALTHRRQDYRYAASDDVWGLAKSLLILFQCRVPILAGYDDYVEYLSENKHLAESQIYLLLNQMASEHRAGRPTAAAAIREIDRILQTSPL